MALIRSRPRIGLFIRGGTYAYQASIIFGAHEECEKLGLDLYCLAGGGLSQADPRSHVYDVPAAGDLDGAVLAPGTWNAPLDHPNVTELIERFRSLPSCVIGAHVDGMASVRIDNGSGVEELTRHLVTVHGRRRVGFIRGHGEEAAERRAGYEQGLRGVGITPRPEWITGGSFTAEDGEAAVQHWFGGGEPAVDAIVAANDWMAIGAVKALRERGLRVPEDVAVVGFDDIEQASFLSPPLTSIRQLPNVLGMKAVELVHEQLLGQAGERQLSVPTSVEIRQSCGCFGRAAGVTQPERYAMLPNSGPINNARQELAAAMVEVAGALSHGLAPDWAERIVEALCSDIDGVTEHGFLDRVTALVGGSAHRGNITGWHHIIAHLREKSIPSLACQLGHLLAAETLFNQAHIAIGEHAERAQGRRLMDREAVRIRLEDAGVAARTALDWPSLREVLAEHLPGLGIPACYVAVGSGGPNHDGHQLVAFDQSRELDVPDDRVKFRMGDFIATRYLPRKRHSMIVHPLFVRNEALGHCCLEIDVLDGGVYKAVGDMISSALKATQLSEALVIEATARERAEKARLVQELEIAARIQTAILPKSPSVCGLDIATKMVPATEVGGDYFDILPFDGGCWLGIGDVAGHGLPTGLVMLMIQSIFAATVHGNPELSPARAWLAVNQVLTTNIRDRLKQDEHATLSLLQYHESGQLRFAGAHEDFIVYRRASGSCEFIATPGAWAGAFADIGEAQVPVSHFQLHPGDVLLLYTDGLTEAQDEAHEMFGRERLAAELAKHGERPVGEIRDQLTHAINRWMHEQFDDFTFVLARYMGPEQKPAGPSDS